MPSPFPGMDPYLERRATWADLHQTLITYMREALQLQIRPKYIARIGERVQLLSAQRNMVPDVLIVREPTATYATSAELVADQPITLTTLDDTQRVPYLEILDTVSGDVVTMIELLSPANKEGNEREKYLRKQRELLATDVHFVEIDLLGYGRNTVLARQFVIQEPVNWRYIINVSRAKQRDKLEIYPFSLQQRLPRVGIPLQHPDPDAVLDLPAIFTRSYEVGGYDLLVGYNELPETQLSEKEANWVRQHLTMQT